MLKQQIQNDTSKAIKKGDELTASTLRLLSASILNKEKEKRYKISKHLPAQAGKPDLKEEDLIKESQLTDEEIIEVVSSEIKKRKESILAFEKGEREDLANKEKKELEILQKYLPEQLSEEELKKIIQEAITKTGAKEIKDMGRVMAELMPETKGRADAGSISSIVKQILSSK